MILEPHATLQGEVTWRNQCHDRATLQGAIIPSAILKIVFRHILFYFCFFNAVARLGFDERRLLYRLQYTCFFMLSVVTTREMETTRGRDDKDRPLMKSAACMMSSETLSAMLFIVSLTLSYR